MVEEIGKIERYTLGDIDYFGRPGHSAVSRPALLERVGDTLSNAFYEYMGHATYIDLSRVQVLRTCLVQDSVTSSCAERLDLGKLKAIFISAPEQPLKGNSIGVAVKIDRLTGGSVWSNPEPCVGLSLAGVAPRYDMPLNLPVPVQDEEAVWSFRAGKIDDSRGGFKIFDRWIRYGYNPSRDREHVLVFIANPSLYRSELYVTSEPFLPEWVGAVEDGNFKS